MMQRLVQPPAAVLTALLLLGSGADAAATKAALTETDAPVPCPAFARDRTGGWKVLAPVMLNIAGTLVSFTVGTNFHPGTTKYGYAMPVILDRECGNGATRRAEAPGRRTVR